MLLTLIGVQSFAKPIAAGHYVLAGARTCLNGSSIEDSGFTGNVTEYTFDVAAGTLQISMKFKGAPVSLDYTWTDLNSGKIQVSPIAQGSNEFQISQADQQLTALFEDRTGKLCGGGQIATPMKLLQ
jgi:hypothetical protein